MDTYTAKNRDKRHFSVGRIIAFGLSHDDLNLLQNNLPTKEHELYVPDDVRDILALDNEAVIVNAASISKSERDTITDYYHDLGSSVSESVFWIGYPKPPANLRLRFLCYQSMNELACVLSEKLITAHRRIKKTRPFSKNLADCLIILSLIRSNPGIKTQELSERLELPKRTVQRHISTLQATGEWIEYNTHKRGWYLQYGVSILFGDHMDNLESKYE